MSAAGDDAPRRSWWSWRSAIIGAVLAVVGLVAAGSGLTDEQVAPALAAERDALAADNALLRAELRDAVSRDCVVLEGTECRSVGEMVAWIERLQTERADALAASTQAAQTITGPTGIQTIDDLLACVDAIATGGNLAACVPALISLLSLGLF